MEGQEIREEKHGEYFTEDEGIEILSMEGNTDEGLDGKIVYLAGPMRGIEHFNRPAFYAAEARIQQEGALVLNPARLPIGMPDTAYMPICLAMLEQADILFLLQGWEMSEGAILEAAYAREQGKTILEIKSE